ncbi:Zn-dependent hydrolase [Roseococcus sp. YIM B11640]|uniref:Zn-dependent hydrolase n=1 Tax=Roseococcus sp. YIM B11640 TaxID=3133973 RepID=UPI003C7DD74D
MSTNIRPDIALASRLFDALREKTFDGLGVTREAYGPGEEVAHALVRAEAEKLGLEVTVDFAGNMYMTLPGTDRSLPQIILGSHLDSVPQGGNFDGAAGVLCGMAVIAGMKQAGFQPKRDVTAMAIRAEEGGAWFNGFPGSRGALGSFKPENLALLRRDTGKSLEHHMRELGFDPDALREGRKVLSKENVHAYVELHIEQGPVLDAEQIPVGLVTALPGNRRVRAGRIVGEWNHSGATPRAYRHDAAMALAEFTHRLDLFWGELDADGTPMVCTFCTVETPEQAGFGKVPGEISFSLDIRAPEPETLDRTYAEIDRLVAEISQSRGVSFQLESRQESAPTPMDAGIREALRQSAEALGISYKVMPSGGGHDAAAFAQAGIPSCMVFVRNQNGSHTPLEQMRIEDFAEASAVIAGWAMKAAS